MKHKKNKGFTTTELLMVTFISGFILVSVYQLAFSSIKLFLNVKRDSDNLETKAPSMELLDRFFDRWGVGVITKAGSTDEKVIPITDRYLDVGGTYNGGSTLISPEATDHPIIFYGNMSGFGFVNDTSGNLISCRLNSKLVTTSPNDCYYVMRNANILPANLDANGNTYLDSVSLVNYTFSTATTAKECVESGFDGSANSTVSTAATITDSSGTVPGSITLLPGDLLIRSPHRVKLYVAPNPNDKNANWLYASLTDMASKCAAGNSFTEPLAPANSIKATLLTTTGPPPKQSVQIDIVFRSSSKDIKGASKTFPVRKIYGAQ